MKGRKMDELKAKLNSFTKDVLKNLGKEFQITISDKKSKPEMIAILLKELGPSDLLRKKVNELMSSKAKEAAPKKAPAKRPPKKPLKEAPKEAAPKIFPKESPQQVSGAPAQALTYESILQVVNEYCLPYFHKIDMLEKSIEDIKEKFDKFSVNQAPITISQFKENLHEQYQKIVQSELKLGGLVPIPKIKEKFKAVGVKISEKIFNQYLLELENLRVIDLQVASDPEKVPKSEEGILKGNRGLIYYIAWR
jgi:hypothetical protein